MGIPVGDCEGIFVGAVEMVGARVGCIKLSKKDKYGNVALAVGEKVGATVGIRVGLMDGTIDGKALDEAEGLPVAAIDGIWLG